MVLSIYEPLEIEFGKLGHSGKIIELIDFEELKRFTKIHGKWFA